MLLFKKTTKHDALDIYNWRTSEHVTKYMYTDILNFEHHKIWLEKTLEKKSEQYFTIYENETKIGLISLNNIDFQNKKATSGFYIGDLKYAPLSSRILPYFLNYAFFEMNLNKLVIEVMTTNINMKKMDLFYGFREVGVLKEHILKNGEYYDVDILELTKSSWLEKKKFHKYKAEFEKD